MTSANAQPPVQTTQPTEPALNSGLMMGLSSVIIGGITVLGLPLSNDAKFWIVLGISFLGPLLSALRTRGLVFSPATWERAQAESEMVLHDLLQAESQIATHASIVSSLQTVVVDALHAVVPVPAAVAAVAVLDTNSQTAAVPVVPPIQAITPQGWMTFPPVQPTTPAASQQQFQDPALTQSWSAH